MASRKEGQGSKWITKKRRLAIYLRDGGKCIYCGAHVSTGVLLTLDHVLACNNGGTNESSNLVTACRSCNSSKSDLTTRMWYAVCRDRGIDTKKLSRRISHQTSIDMAAFLTASECLLASIGEDDEIANIGILAA